MSGWNPFAAADQPPPTEIAWEAQLTKTLDELRSTDVVKEVYEVAQRLVKAEEDRMTRVDAKANALLNATGLSLTLIFTFGASVLLAHPDYVRPLGVAWRAFAAISFAIASGAGMTASVYAARATRLRLNTQTVSDEEIVREDMLKSADKADGEKSGEGVRMYRRFLAEHMILIARGNQHVVRSRARLAQRGQTAFVVFLFALLAIACVIVRAVARAL